MYLTKETCTSLSLELIITTSHGSESQKPDLMRPVSLPLLSTQQPTFLWLSPGARGLLLLLTLKCRHLPY